MTTCTGHSNLYPGIYLGLRNAENVVVDIKDYKSKFVNSKNEEYDWDIERKEFPYVELNVRYGAPEYTLARAIYDKKRAEQDILIAQRRSEYSHKKFPYLRRSTLQNNNVYPANLALTDFEL